MGKSINDYIEIIEEEITFLKGLKDSKGRNMSSSEHVEVSKQILELIRAGSKIRFGFRE